MDDRTRDDRTRLTPGGDALIIPIGTSLAEANRLITMATLERCGGVKKKAAAILGVSLKTLYNRLEEYRARGLVPGGSLRDRC